MAKRENTELKENLSNSVSKKTTDDTNKKRNYKPKYRKPYKKNVQKPSDDQKASATVEAAPKNLKVETEQPQNTQAKPKQRNYRNNRYNNRKNKPENKQPEKPIVKEELPLPKEEIMELRAVPEEPNVDMDFSFLEASREDIEDMIAEMDDEGNEISAESTVDNKYKKEKIIIGNSTQAGSVLQPSFFKKVATSKGTAKAEHKHEDKHPDKIQKQHQSKDAKEEKGNKSKPGSAKETNEMKARPSYKKQTGSSVLNRIFLERYNLAKPVKDQTVETPEIKTDKPTAKAPDKVKDKPIIKQTDTAAKATGKPVTKQTGRPAVKATDKLEDKATDKLVDEPIDIVENEEVSEPLREEDIYKYDKLSFDPKVQKFDSKITYDLVEPVEYISAKTSLSERQEKHPAVRKVLDAVNRFLQNELYIDHEFRILIAVSGGVDSVVLMDAIALLTQKFNYNIAVAHYNHNLRGLDSDEDEQFVKQFAERYNTKIFTANGKVRAYSEKNALSIEHAARILRYKFFERTSRNIDADFVATAHTADDSAETLLLNLLRGSGLTGLAGIPKIRTFVKNVRLIRPLLEMRKTDLINYAKERRLIWKEDKSNQLLDYTRNKVRLSLIPMLEKTYNPNIIDTLNRTAKLINGADEFIADMVNNSIDYVIDDVRQERFAVKTNLLQTFPEFVQGEIIQQLVNKYFRISSLPMKKIAEILELINHQSGAIYQINKNYHVLADRKRLIFTKVEDYTKISESFLVAQGFENAEISLKVTPVQKNGIKFNENPYEEYIDKSKITKSLKIRNWEEGDVFVPLGMCGTMKVSDFLTNQKIALIDKEKVLVLVSGNEIVWIVGHRVSDKFKVDKTTFEAYKFNFTQKNGSTNEQKSDGLE